MSTNTVATLQQAESALVQSLRAATAALNQVGTSELAAALAEYQAAVLAAQTRLADAVGSVRALAPEVADFASCVAQEAAALLGEPAPEAQPSAPEVVTRPEPQSATATGKKKGKGKGKHKPTMVDGVACYSDEMVEHVMGLNGTT